jgi:hypothetical protein
VDIPRIISIKIKFFQIIPNAIEADILSIIPIKIKLFQMMYSNLIHALPLYHCKYEAVGVVQGYNRLYCDNYMEYINMLRGKFKVFECSTK